MGQATRDALTAIAAGDNITDDVVAGLRQAVYADGEIDAGEARRLLQLHATASVSAAAWADFFVEAVADYFALQREAPADAVEFAPNYLRAAETALKAATFQTGELKGDADAPDHAANALSTDDADALITAFKAEGRLALDTIERRLLARLFDRCVELPDAFRRFALDAVYATVMEDGCVEPDEAALLRRVLWGPASDEGIAVSRREAEVLFAIANKTSRADNAPEWRDVFVKGIASYLLFAGSTPERVDAGEAAWLAAKLNRPGAMDPLRGELVTYLHSEAVYMDPRLEPFLAAA